MNVDLQSENGLVCLNLAKTSSEKIINHFHPSLVPYYAVKLDKDAKKILFHKAKKGAIKALKGFDTISFEIPFEEVDYFKKKPFIISFGYNIFMPRFELALKSGQVFHACIGGGGGTGGAGGIFDSFGIIFCSRKT